LSQPTRQRVKKEDPYRLIDIFYGCFGEKDVRPDIAQAILAYENNRSPSGGTLLDMGCGTGCITVPLAELSTETWGLDAEERAIELTRRRRDAHGVSNLTLKQGNWVHLSEIVPCDFFDTIVCWGNSLNYTDSWLSKDLELGRSQRLIEATLRKVHDCLKQNGVFVLQVDGGFTEGEDQVRRRTMTVEENSKRHVLEWKVEQTAEGIRRNRARRKVYSAERGLLDIYEIEFVGQALYIEHITEMLKEAGFNRVEVNSNSSQEAFDSYHVVIAGK